jgi:hypothetical protein
MENSVVALVTLYIASAGLLVAIGGFLWQLLTYRLVGSRVRARTAMAFPAFGPVIVGSTAAIGVTATNIGRTAISIRRWGLLFPDDTKLVLGSFDDIEVPEEGIRIANPHRVWALRDFENLYQIGSARELEILSSDEPTAGIVPIQDTKNRLVRSVGMTSPWLISPALPHAIEAGDAATWFVDEQQLRGFCRLWGFNVPLEVRGFVELSNGRFRRSRNKCMIPQERNFELYIGHEAVEGLPKGDRDSIRIDIGLKPPIRDMSLRLLRGVSAEPSWMGTAWLARIVNIGHVEGKLTIGRPNIDTQKQTSQSDTEGPGTP